MKKRVCQFEKNIFHAKQDNNATKKRWSLLGLKLNEKILVSRNDDKRDQEDRRWWLTSHLRFEHCRSQWARNWKRIPKAINETIRVEDTVVYSHFNSKTVEPKCQSSSMFRFIQARHQGDNQAHQNNCDKKKMFVEKTKRSLVMAVWKWL